MAIRENRVLLQRIADDSLLNQTYEEYSQQEKEEIEQRCGQIVTCYIDY